MSLLCSHAPCVYSLLAFDALMRWVLCYCGSQALNEKEKAIIAAHALTEQLTEQLQQVLPLHGAPFIRHRVRELNLRAF